MTRPALDDGGSGGAVDVIVTGRAAGAGSLISQAARESDHSDQGRGQDAMAARRFPRPRSALADATWPGARRESAVTAATAMLWLLELPMPTREPQVETRRTYLRQHRLAHLVSKCRGRHIRELVAESRRGRPIHGVVAQGGHQHVH